MLFMTKSAVAFLVTNQNWKIYPSFFSYKKRNNLFRLSNISQTKITLNFLRDKQSLAAALHIILFSFFYIFRLYTSRLTFYVNFSFTSYALLDFKQIINVIFIYVYFTKCFFYICMIEIFINSKN